jgi:hypothetical protein
MSQPLVQEVSTAWINSFPPKLNASNTCLNGQVLLIKETGDTRFKIL